ncbi:MAG TPA: hypothetical protein VHA82_03200 [Ramlibacter sp.]|uniref:hypothetical protein n=1 Tax=Ramlibacter sp. TaxID=1917967 RepID=UPI002CF5EA6C|nr:hypothetical protein [Ramlibacter sp.]HVZ42793.1 hypothetical protein [Ramlibacter sp.]
MEKLETPQKSQTQEWGATFSMGDLTATASKTVQVPQNDGSSSLSLAKYKFHEEFSDTKLEEIRHKAERERTLVGPDTGSFEKVLEAAKKTAEYSRAMEKGVPVKESHHLVLTKEVQIGRGQMMQQTTELMDAVKTWTDRFDEEGQRKQSSIGKSVESNTRRDAKMQACEDLTAGAKIIQAQQQMKIEQVAKAKDPQEFRLLDAKLLREVYGMQPAGGGTSEVGLIAAPDKSVAYAFKSVAGESDQMGTAKGAGAIREVLTSRVADVIKNGPSQLDFGWPATSFARLSGVQGGSAELGVLVDGINGKKIYDDDALDHVRKTGGNVEQKKAESADRFAKMPASEIQKVLMCNLAMAQFDIKWDNVIVEEHPGGLKARPYDGGAAFPDKDTFMDMQMGRPSIKGEKLLFLDINTKHLAADLSMNDPQLAQMRDKFLLIDEEAVRKVMAETVKQAGIEGIPANVVASAQQGCELTLKSIQGMKEVIRSDQNMTLGTFLQRCETEVFQGIAKDMKQEWLQEKKMAYDRLQEKHPDLLKPSSVFQGDDQKYMFGNFLKPDEFAKFQKLAEYGAQNLAQHNIAVPLSEFGTCTAALGRVPAEVRAAHPAFAEKSPSHGLTKH